MIVLLCVGAGLTSVAVGVVMEIYRAMKLIDEIMGVAA